MNGSQAHHIYDRGLFELFLNVKTNIRSTVCGGIEMKHPEGNKNFIKVAIFPVYRNKLVR